MAEERHVTLDDNTRTYSANGDEVSIRGNSKDNTFIIDQAKPLRNAIAIAGGGGQDTLRIINAVKMRLAEQGTAIELLSGNGSIVSTLRLAGIQDLELQNGHEKMALPGIFIQPKPLKGK